MYRRRRYRGRRKAWPRSKIFRPELKFLDSVQGGAVSVATGGTIPLATYVGMQQGTTSSTRIGRRIVIRSIGVTLTLSIPQSSTAADASDIIRCILVYDKQPNGAQPAFGDIIEGAGFDRYRNLDFTRRFVLLHDKCYRLNSMGAASVASPAIITLENSQCIRIFKSGLALPVYYDTDVGDITDVQTGNLFMIFFAQAGVCTIDSTARIRYSE